MKAPRLKTVLIAISALLGLALAGGAAILIISSRPGEDVLAGRRGPVGDASPGASGPRIPGAGGGPLFRFGNPYLDGASAWLAGRFREEREALRSVPVPVDPAIECAVRRAPFTEGPWVDSLLPELARQRNEIESQTVETRVTFFVPGGEPRAVLRYTVGSDFLARLPGEGKIERELIFPPLESRPEGLQAVPALASNEWLSRDRMSRPLAIPTDAFHVHAAFREGETAAHVIQAWENVPGEGKSPIRLGATQWAIAPRPGGVLVRMTSYYSGQSIPPLLDALAVHTSASFCRKVASTLTAEAMAWTPSPDLARRLERIGI